MNASLDLSRWREAPRGVGYRRRVMVEAGLRQLLQLRIFKALLAVAWSAGFALAVLGFVFAQSVSAGGWVESIAEYFGPRGLAVAKALTALVMLYPDVCIEGWFTLLFWAHSFVGLMLSLVALTTMVPRLITLDRATNALTVYLSRPLTSTDYLLGKLGLIVAVLALMWTGPLLFGWVLSVGFAPSTDFIVYSFGPLLRALAFHAIGVVTLAAIALGVSASVRTSRAATVTWIGLWLIFGALASPPRTPEWLKRTSFSHNLGEVRQGVFRLDRALQLASDSLPILDKNLTRNMAGAGARAKPSDFPGALGSLAVFVAAGSFVFLRRLRPE